MPSDEFRRVDDEDVGVVEVLVERLPRPLEQQCVADGQRAFARTLVLAPALNGQDDEVAARRDHSGEHQLPDHRGTRRDHDLGQTRCAVEERLDDVVSRILQSERERFVGSQTGGRLCFAAHDQPIALGERGPTQWTRLVRGLHSDECETGVVREVDGARRRIEVRRARAQSELEEPVVEPVLLDQRPRVLAQIGRHRATAPVRQQALSEQHDDRDGPEQQRDSDDGELEESEWPDAGFHGGVRQDHVDGCAGEREQ